MAITLKVYDNGDHACLVWCPVDDQQIPNCWGFAVRRIKNGAEDFLVNTTGFDPDEAGPKPSTEWPIQRFLWWDYDVKLNDSVQYSVIPLLGQKLAPADTSICSPLTPPMKISGQSTASLSAFFNRGIIATQWVTKALDKVSGGQGKRSTLTELVEKPGNPLRDALGGLLKKRVLELLQEAKAEGGSIFSALYELNDPELFDALKDLGASANLILANGAFGKTSKDENADIRHRLQTETEVKVYDRMVSQGHFAHNKYVVFCDSAGKPKRVLTGSTNWTINGLCAQANNGLVIDDAQVADAYFQEWQRLHSAGNGFPQALVSANSQQKTFTVDGNPLTVWFAPTDQAEDLEHARRLINQARHGVLFLFFNPGAFQEDPNHWTLLQSILNRHQGGDNPYFDPSLYIRGVVNQEIAGLTEPPPPGQTQLHDRDLDPSSPVHPVALFTGGKTPPLRLDKDVLVPKAIQQQYARWEPELLGKGMVLIHSKVVVIDPFGEHPVVITGSHNLGFKASTKNDDNMVIIEGNAALAAAYAINIIAIYQTYRWRHYLLNTGDPNKKWRGLAQDDKWQNGHLVGDSLAELDFWLGRNQPGPGPSPAQANTAVTHGSRVPPATNGAPTESDPISEANSKSHAGGRKKVATPAHNSAVKKKSVKKKSAKPSRNAKKKATKKKPKKTKK